MWALNRTKTAKKSRFLGQLPTFSAHILGQSVAISVFSFGHFAHFFGHFEIDLDSIAHLIISKVGFWPELTS